ncbi:MAG TPA: hypothetical protein VEF04_08100 [Blastocatellia bacterium]|nr:hypothetical protein [Blastocatellia bacterium]
MTRPLRKIHRWTLTLLAIALPLLFVAALQARKEIPPNNSLPELMTATQRIFVLESEFDVNRAAVHVRLLREESSNTQWLEIQATQELSKPDVVAYWSANKPDNPDSLVSAILIGPLSHSRPTRVPLFNSSGKMPMSGWLTLYSIAHKELITSMALTLPQTARAGGTR